MPNELKPCPFCGSKAKVIKIPDGLNWAGLYVVGCDNDSMCMGNINHFTMVFFTPETAAEAWNRRVDEVVRCKDCEFFSPKTNFCRCHDTPIYEDDFCNYGERKE